MCCTVCVYVCRWCVIYERSWSWSSVCCPRCYRPLRVGKRAKATKGKMDFTTWAHWNMLLSHLLRACQILLYFTDHRGPSVIVDLEIIKMTDAKWKTHQSAMLLLLLYMYTITNDRTESPQVKPVFLQFSPFLYFFNLYYFKNLMVLPCNIAEFWLARNCWLVLYKVQLWQ